MPETIYNEVTPEILKLTKLCEQNCVIDPALYSKYEVKRGLRDINGKGVLAGLTNIAEVKAYTIDDGELIPCEGKLYYHGYDVEELVGGCVAENRYGFEEVTFLLLFGRLPNQQELKDFQAQLAFYADLPTSFTRDVILKAPSRDMMNSLARSVLTLYSYDPSADDISIPNVLRQSLQMIARFPRLAVYSYQAYKHYFDNQSLYIHHPHPNLSTAENILYMLRPDNAYSELEARVLDIALMIHADHGGGNNSTFATRVVSSSGTDTYSAIAAALGSLKGPRHGGANIKVAQMFDDMKKNVSNWNNDTQICQYLSDLLDKKAFDKSGLIYGMGHAVYSLSDPRAKIFREWVKKLSEEKDLQEEFQLYANVERLAPEVIAEKRNIYKGVSANVDFYSGFVYRMLGLPDELFTPIFAIARISGWCAHRIEELLSAGKIIRPAYKSIRKHRSYQSLDQR
jgi:citrate synthase